MARVVRRFTVVLLPERPRLRRSAACRKKCPPATARRPALLQVDDVVGKALRLREVVRGHDDGRALRMDAAHDVLDRARRLGVEAGRRLVEEQHLGPQRPRPRQRQPLLLAARQHPRRPRGQRAQAHFGQRVVDAPLRVRAVDAGQRQRVADVRGGRAAQQHRPLEHHRLSPRTRELSAPGDAARRRRHQSVQQPQQRALAGTVGAEDHGSRPRHDRHVDAGQQRHAAANDRGIGTDDRQAGRDPVVSHSAPSPTPAWRAPLR